MREGQPQPPKFDAARLAAKETIKKLDKKMAGEDFLAQRDEEDRLAEKGEPIDLSHEAEMELDDQDLQKAA